jgi:hypothetical protein
VIDAQFAGQGKPCGNKHGYCDYDTACRRVLSGEFKKRCCDTTSSIPRYLETIDLVITTINGIPTLRNSPSQQKVSTTTSHHITPPPHIYTHTHTHTHTHTPTTAISCVQRPWTPTYHLVNSTPIHPTNSKIPNPTQKPYLDFCPFSFWQLGRFANTRSTSKLLKLPKANTIHLPSPKSRFGTPKYMPVECGSMSFHVLVRSLIFVTLLPSVTFLLVSIIVISKDTLDG